MAAHIRPVVGSRVRFSIWHDYDRLGFVYTDVGDGINRPATFDEWTGTVTEIQGQPFRAKLMSHRDTYIIKRDFDNQEYPFNIQHIVGYTDK